MTLPLRIFIGRCTSSAATARYFWLQPLQSSSLAEFGATAPVAAVLAVMAAVVALAEPVTLVDDQRGPARH